MIFPDIELQIEIELGWEIIRGCDCVGGKGKNSKNNKGTETPGSHKEGETKTPGVTNTLMNLINPLRKTILDNIWVRDVENERRRIENSGEMRRKCARENLQGKKRRGIHGRGEELKNMHNKSTVTWKYTMGSTFNSVGTLLVDTCFKTSLQPLESNPNYSAQKKLSSKK